MPACPRARTQVFGAACIYRYSGPKHRGRAERPGGGERTYREAVGPPPVAHCRCSRKSAGDGELAAGALGEWPRSVQDGLGSYRPCYGPVETGRTEREFERALERRFTAEDPIRDGFRWEAEAFTSGWVQVFPVYSRVGNLYRRLRGWSPDGYVGGYVFVRRSDGLVVELGSTPFLFWPEVFEGVFGDIGETASAEEIKAEIIARSKAHWAEQGLADDDLGTSIDELLETAQKHPDASLLDILDDEYRTREPGA
jgi:hypothetical protein